MTRSTNYLTLIVLLAAAGCGSATPSTETGDSLSGMRSHAGRTLVEMTQTENTCEMATIYFAYDSDDLDSAARDDLTRVAQCISQGRGLPIHLSGAADPRGTEEYNFALGERRALAVHRYMLALGIDPSRVSFSSVGEEFARGSNEATWQLDRHVMPRVREVAVGLASPTASLR
jgi:peptidoglycan-associated lipoprotein